MLTKSDLEAIERIVETKIDVSIKRELKPVKSDIRKIQKTVDLGIGSSDRRITHLEKSAKRIEDHLGFPPQQN